MRTAEAEVRKEHGRQYQQAGKPRVEAEIQVKNAPTLQQEVTSRKEGEQSSTEQLQ